MIKKLLCSLIAIFALSMPASAEPVKFVIGEWSPYISATLDGYGPHSIKIREIYKKAGMDVEFEFMPWNRAYDMVKSGKAVGSFSWTKVDSRLPEVNFPVKPIAQSTNRAFYLKSKHPNGLEAHTIEDLHAKGYKFVGVRGYWYEKQLLKLGAKLQTVRNAGLAWKVLHSGQADVYLAVEEVAKAGIESTIGKAAIDKFGSESEPVMVSKMYPIFAKNHPMSQKVLEVYEANAPDLQ